MLSQKLHDAINEQINRELYSAYLYQAMSAHFAFESWGGFAHWMHLQAKEEQEHAERFYEYLLDRGARVTFKAIEQPPVEFGSALDIFKASYEHEQYITASINAIYELAVAEKGLRHAANALVVRQGTGRGRKTRQRERHAARTRR